MKTTKPELEVPEAALHRALEFNDGLVAEEVRYIATPVVVAELRRLADYYRQLGRDAGDYRSIGADLNRRAGKLEAQS